MKKSSFAPPQTRELWHEVYNDVPINLTSQNRSRQCKGSSVFYWLEHSSSMLWTQLRTNLHLPHLKLESYGTKCIMTFLSILPHKIGPGSVREVLCFIG